MRHRKLEVRMVKTNENKDAQSSQYDTHIEGRVAHITFTIDRVVSRAARAALAYVVLDTLRQVMVAKANQSK